MYCLIDRFVADSKLSNIFYRMLEKEKNILEIQKRRYLIDLCIHCRDPKTISDFAVLQYQDGRIEVGPICNDCYSINKK